LEGGHFLGQFQDFIQPRSRNPKSGVSLKCLHNWLYLRQNPHAFRTQQNTERTDDREAKLTAAPIKRTRLFQAEFIRRKLRCRWLIWQFNRHQFLLS
jgi:hypothetical protein